MGSTNVLGVDQPAFSFTNCLKSVSTISNRPNFSGQKPKQLSISKRVSHRAMSDFEASTFTLQVTPPAMGNRCSFWFPCTKKEYPVNLVRKRRAKSPLMVSISTGSQVFSAFSAMKIPLVRKPKKQWLRLPWTEWGAGIFGSVGGFSTGASSA